MPGEKIETEDDGKYQDRANASSDPVWTSRDRKPVSVWYAAVYSTIG